jgi:trehalose 6-phosphate synthase/phosphatase
MAIPSPQALEVLSSLLSDPKNTVYIISGRDGTFLEQHFGDFKQLGLSAEHGSFLRAPGSNEWENLTETLDMSWMSDVEEIFKYYTEASGIDFLRRALV